LESEKLEISDGELHAVEEKQLQFPITCGTPVKNP
jgi:hypothetical protein